MPWNLLLLPLLGGYFSLKHTHYLRFRHQRLEGYRLLMDSALFGVVLFLAARSCVWLAVQFETGRAVAFALSRLAPFPFFGTAVGAFALGLAFPLITNLWLTEPKASLREIHKLNDVLLSLLTKSVETSSLVLVTLETRKVYAAYVAEAPNLETGGNARVKLAPVRSGYRDESDLTVHFTEYYEEAYLESDFESDDLAIIVPISRIVSVQTFDTRLYDETFAAGDDEDGDEEDPVWGAEGPSEDPSPADSGATL